MKATFALLALSLITLPAFAAGARSTQLTCHGELKELHGNFKDGISETPVTVGFVITGEDPMRYGTRVRLDNISVSYNNEKIEIAQVEKRAKFNSYLLVQPYDNLLIVDLSWYQNIRDLKGKKWVTPNNLVIKALPKTMQTTGDGVEKQDGTTESSFNAQVDLSLSNGDGKIDYTAHTANGVLQCSYGETL